MNLLFQTAKPRRFSHPMVYCDERRERLRQLEDRARRELGMEADGRQAGERLADVQPGECLRPGQLFGRRRGVVTRRSWIPSMAIVALVVVIVLTCLLPWL